MERSGGRLAWVQRNRRRNERTRTLGDLAARLAGGLGNDEALQRVARMLADRVDSEFRRHCRVAEIRGGRLTISVDRPALVAVMRWRWLTPIGAALRTARPCVGVDRIAFACGTVGVSIPEPASAGS